MPDKIRSFCKKTNQIIPETKGEMVMTIMQSLALKYKQVSMQIDEIKDKKHKMINIIGGGCRNQILSQFTADSTKKSILAGPVEATSVGNILVQLLAMGEIRDLKEARELSKRSFEIKSYEPIDASAWDEAYADYLKIIK